MSHPSASAGSTAPANVHPRHINAEVHLPYTGREVEIFSRYGYFTPPGYHPSTPADGWKGLRIALTSTEFGMKPDYFKRFGKGAAKFLGCFMLFYLPFDSMFFNLRKIQRDRREKMRSS